MRTLRNLASGLALAAALALTGCAGGASPDTALTPDGPGSPTPVVDAPLAATTWTVTGVDGAPAPAGRARFTLAPDGGASGNLGCNRFTAPGGVTGPLLTLGPISSTRMACEGPVGDLERALSALLGGGPLTWKVEGETLTLTGSDGRKITAEAASAAE
ncbi:META domain-containing protein [Streptomyces sp. RerS4]|uniref:META domain-containing protein n=1 Tax=Streptomyces sp. RerS4 TaxID=2942449 RepID=UPI00201C9E64|nr:META domain-containing protein [Streptomyces sp. RerS4]UQX02143.1 META domain-containing protein [Streptomyces sp. RerS4]